MKILGKMKTLVAGVMAFAMGFAVVAAPATQVMAASGGSATGNASAGKGLANQYFQSAGGDSNDATLMQRVSAIINVILGLVGLVSVAVIILGGFQYTTSAGDTAKVTKAKNTILYGIIGLVIALLAFAIVNFVLGQIMS